MRRIIPHSQPTLGSEEIEAVSKVIAGGEIAQGRVVAEFEEKLAHHVGCRGGVATSSGTAALHLSLLALGIGKGNEVLLPSFTCVALLHAIRYVGAVPRLVEVDGKSFNIDIRDLERRISPRSRAIIVPHMFGLPVAMERIKKLGLPVIEDCAQTFGVNVDGQPVGSLGEIAVFSFYATKLMTTGEGGMVISTREDYLEKIRDLREYDKKETFARRFNYKLTDMQAAMGLVQLKKLTGFIRRRKELARKYARGLKDLPISLPQAKNGDHAFYRYVIQVDPQKVHSFIVHMEGLGVCCRRPVYRPLHHYLKADGMGVTQRVWERSVSLPLYPSLTDESAERISRAVRQFWSEAH